MSSGVSYHSSNLVVPSTQNTAPVFEFRCLYSHDLRRKSKRWQDGFIRFHTFNKRILVYDVPRNYIGDTHWREDGVVQDGDELQLEKGVLVQVGEATGRMEQDLTALFEKTRRTQKRDCSEAVPPSSSSVSNPRHAAAPLSQLRPKSLNAVLGISKGPRGRVVFPSKSPYEERHQKLNEGWEEGRSSKRQRKDYPRGRDTPRLQALSKDVGERHPSETGRRVYLSPVAPRPHNIRQQSTNEPIIVESDDERKGVVSSPVHINEKAVQSAVAETCQKVAELRCDIAPSQSSSPRGPLTLPPLAITQKPPSHKVVNIPSTSNKEAQSKSTRSSHAVVNPLRFASRKPRQKLLYEELLPQKDPWRDKPEGNTGPGIRQKAGAIAAMKSVFVANPTNDSHHYHDTRTTQLGIEKRHPDRDSVASVNRVAFDLEDNDISRSEVVSSHSRVQHRMSSLEQPSLDSEGASSSSLGDIFKSGAGILESVPNIPQASSLDLSGNECIGTNSVHERGNPQDSSVVPPTAHSTSELIYMDQVLLHFPEDSEPADAKPRTRSPLRKALSETNKPLTGAKTSPTLTRRRLQKAVSDSHAINDTSMKQNSHLPQAPVTEKDLGPWSREAFDLFGFQRWTEKGKGASSTVA